MVQQWHPMPAAAGGGTSKGVPYLPQMARAVSSRDRFRGLISAGVVAASEIPWFYSLPRDPVSLPNTLQLIPFLYKLTQFQVITLTDKRPIQNNALMSCEDQMTS